ncbi:MAG TPA: 6-phosphogluconolactonase [Planctomycetota bacterium]|nr:6-phosphogluconolactonase [Planctomycetota bacterium]
MTDLRVFTDTHALDEAAAHTLLEAVRSVLGGKPRASIALSGGSSPRPIYEELSRLDKKTRRRALDSVDFFFGDERCVAPDDPESNYKMALEALGADRHFHRMEGERPDRDAAAQDYEKLLPQPLDVLILGIGDDGHTASLFPGAASLDERKRRVIAVTDSPKPPPERLTITPATIEAARSIFMIALGEKKADAVKRALEGAWNPKETPAQLARRGTWILDAAAASRLKR